MWLYSPQDSQDIRFMGGLSFQIPYTSVCLGVSSFALCGMPFLAGFYSRDFILEMVSFSYINLIGFGLDWILDLDWILVTNHTNQTA
jgi:NADH-ubiquinone oxidoreductase chain 5